MRSRTSGVLAAVVVVLLLGLAPAAAQPAERMAPPGHSLGAYGYGDTSLQGTYGTSDLFVPVPAGTRATAARIALDLAVSPLLEGHSTLTVHAGGIPLSTVRLTGERPVETLVAEVPADRIGPDGLALGFRGYLRLTTDDCEETDNPAQFVTVLDTSTVEFELERRTDVVVADVPALFGGPPRDAAVVIDIGDPAAASLDAAAIAAWQVGRWRAAGGAEAAVTTVGEDIGGHPTIVIGAPTGTSDSDDRGPTGPALSLDNADAPRLTVTGADREELLIAARALTRPATLAGLGQPTVRLSGTDATPPPDGAAPWTGDRTTLAQLGVPRQTVVGTGVRELFVPIDRPAGWVVDDDVRVALHVDASAALRPATSTVQLLVNDIDVGSARLDATDGPQVLPFTVPAGLADRTIEGRPVRTLDLTVRMVLDLPEEACSAPDIAAASVSLLPTTTIEVPHRSAATLELGRFPHPLTGPDRTGPVEIVVSDATPPDAAELDAALQIAAALGRWSAPDAQPPIIRRMADAGGGDGGRIVIGGAVAGLAGAAVPDRSPPSGEDVHATLALTDQLDGGRPTLLVIGEGDGLRTAARALIDRDLIGQLAGDVIILQADRAVALADGTLAQPPPQLSPPDRAWFDDRPGYLMPAVVVGTALIAVLLLVILLRWRPMVQGRSRRPVIDAHIP